MNNIKTILENNYETTCTTKKRKLETTSLQIKEKYPPPTRKNLVIADEQISGFFIRKPPPDKDNPVLEFPELDEDTTVCAYLCIYSTDVPITALVVIENALIKKGEKEWVATIKLIRNRTSGDLNLKGVKCFLSIQIGSIKFISNPFLLHTNQTQVIDRSILNILDDNDADDNVNDGNGGNNNGGNTNGGNTNKGSNKIIKNPRSAIYSTLLKIKNTVDRLDSNAKSCKTDVRLHISIYIPTMDFLLRNLLTKLAEKSGITFVYDKNLPHNMVLNISDEILDGSTSKKIITEDELLSMLD